MPNPKPRTEEKENSAEQPKVQEKFVSKFKAWISVVAFLVVAAFLPEQAAQAAQYDWRVIWNRQGAVSALSPLALTNPKTIDIPLTIKNILTNVANKDVNAIKISDDLTIALDKPLKMSKERIEEIYHWLKGKPCGSKALYDYLSYTKATITDESDIAVMALTVDILNDVVKPEGDPKVIKTSLYALSKASEFFGQKLYPVKLDLTHNSSTQPDPRPTTHPVPFIAHVNGDHYVLVTRITDDKVYYSDNHKEEFLPKEKFLKQFTGYALLPAPPLGIQALDSTESKKILGASQKIDLSGNSSYQSGYSDGV